MNNNVLLDSVFTRLENHATERAREKRMYEGRINAEREKALEKYRSYKEAIHRWVEADNIDLPIELR